MAQWQVRTTFEVAKTVLEYSPLVMGRTSPVIPCFYKGSSRDSSLEGWKALGPGERGTSLQRDSKRERAGQQAAAAPFPREG